MTSVQKISISHPAKGLIIYQTNEGEGFYFNQGTPRSPNWQMLGSILGKVNYSDTSGMLASYRSGIMSLNTDTGTLIGRFAKKLNIGDTSSMLSPYLRTGWSLKGNSGISSNDFIGTTENMDLIFKVNNNPAGLISGLSSKENVFIGYLNGSGITSGAYNSAFGYQALIKNYSGNYNTAHGAYSLYFNTTGDNNTGIGYESLKLNTSGSENTSIGVNSMIQNTSGRNNTSAGFESLYSNTADQNTSVGSKSLYKNGSGTSNIAIGFEALQSNTSGSNNTAIGYGADVSTDTLTNSTAIGYATIVNASNKVRIGNGSVTDIEGAVPFTNPSDARFKYNIKKNVPGLSFIKLLKPVTYYFDYEKMDMLSKIGKDYQNKINKFSSYHENKKQLKTGFLAQDVEIVCHILDYDFDGLHVPSNKNDHYGLAYSSFVIPIVQAIQEQQIIIKRQLSTIKQQQKDLAVVIKKLEKLEKNKIKRTF